MDRDYLSFASKFKEPLYNRDKTQTIRFNLQEKPTEGEKLEAVLDTKEVIGNVVIKEVEDLKVADVPDRTFEGHRNYDSPEEVISHLNEYYHDTITPESTVTLITFKFLPG